MFKIYKNTAKVFLAVSVLFGATMFGSSAAVASGEKFVLISHAPDSDSWWNTIKNAIGIAGEQMGVDVDYRNQLQETLLIWLALLSKLLQVIQTALL